MKHTVLRTKTDKKVPNQFYKPLAIVDPLMESLIFTLVDKNQQCMRMLIKNRIVNAKNILRQIDNDLLIILNFSKQKFKLLTSLRNTRAFIAHKQADYAKALEYLDNAYKSVWRTDYLGKAMILLNKYINLASIQGKQKSQKSQKSQISQNNLQLAQQAIQQIKKQHNIQNKFLPLFIIFLQYVIKQLYIYHQNRQILKIYYKGYKIINKFMGHNHYITILFKNMIRKNSQFCSIQKSSKSNRKKYKSRNKNIHLKKRSKNEISLNQSKYYHKLNKSFILYEKEIKNNYQNKKQINKKTLFLQRLKTQNNKVVNNKKNIIELITKRKGILNNNQKINYLEHSNNSIPNMEEIELQNQKQVQEVKNNHNISETKEIAQLIVPKKLDNSECKIF